jgi:hypothetical protein
LYVALSFGRFCKSIPARRPQRVAEILAKLMNGKCFPLSPVGGASMAASGDANSTLFEVYPERTTLNMPQYRTVTIRRFLLKIRGRRWPRGANVFF